MPTKDKRELDQLRREARKIAESLPEPLRKPWLAIAFRADVHTHIVSGKTRETIVRYGRQYAESATSRSALYRAIPELENLGLIKKVSQKTGDRNEKNVYHLNFDAILDKPKAEYGTRDEWLDAMAELASELEVIEREPEPKAKANGYPREPKAKIAQRIEAVVSEHYEPDEPIDEESPADKKFREQMEAERAKTASYPDTWLQFDGFTTTV